MQAIKEGKNVGQILSEDPTATVVDAVKAGVITAADAITADLKGATGILTVEKVLLIPCTLIHCECSCTPYWQQNLLGKWAVFLQLTGTYVEL